MTKIKLLHDGGMLANLIHTLPHRKARGLQKECLLGNYQLMYLDTKESLSSSLTQNEVALSFCNRIREENVELDSVTTTRTTNVSRHDQDNVPFFYAILFLVNRTQKENIQRCFLSE